MRAAQRAADGLLRARHARARGAAARDRDARRPTSTPARSSARSTTDRRRRRVACASGSATCSACGADEVEALVAARRERGPFRSLADLARARAPAGRRWRSSPGRARATRSRRRPRAHGAVAARRRRARRAACREGTQLSLPLELPDAPALGRSRRWEAMVADYATTGLTLGAHPMALLRAALAARDGVTARTCERLPTTRRCGSAALVVARQRPGHREGDRVPPARGRVRDDQPDRAAGVYERTAWSCGPSR